MTPQSLLAQSAPPTQHVGSSLTTSGGQVSRLAGAWFDGTMMICRQAQQASAGLDLSELCCLWQRLVMSSCESAQVLFLKRQGLAFIPFPIVQKAG